MTHVYWHPAIFMHDKAARHVAMERDRIERICAAVRAVPGVEEHLARKASFEEFHRAHGWGHLRLLSRELGEHETHAFDGETIANRYTWDALAFSAGAVCEAVERSLAGEHSAAFCVGYAGHHAMEDDAEGFCFTNQVAIGAHHALKQGAERVAVLDLDTHSGNGTVLSLFNEPRALFAETFQPGYPGFFLQGKVTPSHIRRMRCENVEEFVSAWSKLFCDVQNHKPDVILVSAGFDAHRADPLGRMGLNDDQYTWFGKRLRELEVPVVATLEGGYSVPDAARCAALFVEALGSRNSSEAGAY